MDDIARHLGMSKKTIYQHFGDKNELVLALVEQRIKEDEKQMREIVSTEDNVIRQMLDMMKCSEDIVSKMNPILIHDLQKYHPESWKLIQNFKEDNIVSIMECLLNKGIEQGYIRPEIDVRIIARMRLSQVETGFDNTLFPVSEFNPWKVQQQFLEHFNYGVCTMEGYKLLKEYQNLNHSVHI